jgi:hypothetical protein
MDEAVSAPLFLYLSYQYGNITNLLGTHRALFGGSGWFAPATFSAQRVLASWHFRLHFLQAASPTPFRHGSQRHPRGSTRPRQKYFFDKEWVWTFEFLIQLLPGVTDPVDSNSKSQINMPVHPTEEQAESHVFDKVAKESSDSTASDHAIHKDNAKTAVDPHKTKGPQIPDSEYHHFINLKSR